MHLPLIIYNFIRHSMTAKKKTKTNNNKQETETRPNINSHINHIKSFRSRLAQPKTELHTELSIFINFVKNFCLRHTIKLDTDWILNMTRHSFTMSVDDVLLVDWVEWVSKDAAQAYTTPDSAVS